MIDIRTWDIWLILVLQAADSGLKPVMEFFTRTGYPQAYMLVVGVIYWAFNRKLGLRMAIFLSLTASVNSLLKQAIHAPRPYWVENRITGFHTSGEFGMPSGHAQAVTVWLLAAAYLKKPWFWILAIIITLMVGISRIYLGVHFPSQVVTGWFCGIIILICFLVLEQKVKSFLGKLRVGYQLILISAICMLILLTGLLIVHFLHTRVVLLNLPADISPVGMAAISGNAGGFLGISMGAILMAGRAGFDAGGTWWKRLLRCIVGLAFMLIIYLGLQQISPGEENPFIFSVWRFLALYILTFSAIFLLPILFIRINLLEAGGEPVRQGIY